MECFAKEIKLNGDLEGAYYHLSQIYNYEEKYNNITPFVYNER